MIITLRKILDDQKLLKGFGEFCKIHHASENLDFWFDVEEFHGFFREGESSVSSSPLSPNRKSSRRGLWALTTQFSRKGSKSLLEENPSSPSATDIASRAKQIFDTYLASNAEKWVCTDQAETEEVKKKIEIGIQLDYKLFDTLQKQVYVNIEKDLVPRFEKTFEITEEQANVFAANPRGSVRYVPDQKLRAILTAQKSLNSAEIFSDASS